ncbi:BREX system serine/threonine kinase PglW [Nocardia sp. NPDC058499]|uniref:BREX system serine/threonine kinase PglW n=1 Tax=Nocardia sp. NPDC058499 TaxID=3346530 RepID=UPI003668D37B
MEKGRWTTVTESSFDHERRGLEAIRTRLPDNAPWAAWSNFTFTAQTGHVREVDLLVISPSGVYMVELKDWRGELTWRDGAWVQVTPNGSRRKRRSPVHLVNQKSKELASLLGRHGVNVRVHHAVCFTNSDLKFRLPDGEKATTHTVAGLVKRLAAPAQEPHHRIDPMRAERIAKALNALGIRRSDAEFAVGPYALERKPYDTGPTWQDYLARHESLGELVRIRIYLQERGADQEARNSVGNAAHREATALDRFRHPGVVQLKLFDPSAHSAGPALIFQFHPDTLPLEEYLARYGGLLALADRMGLVRQLVETLRSAHKARIHHRALTAHSIHVVPRPGESEEQRWRAPRLQISDWQLAKTLRAGSAHPGGPRHSSTTLSVQHLSAGTEAYLAPELTAPRPDPIALDVYGLGMLTFLLATGSAPAATQAELLARFESGESLRPSALLAGPNDDLDLLVATATEFKPTLRLTSMDEFLEQLDEVDESLQPPVESEHPEPEPDPLEAGPDDVLGDRWQVVRRLGTGSTSRALLVRDLRADLTKRGAYPLAVLKVALSDERTDYLVKEAEVLRRLRPHSGVITLLEPGVVQLGGRTTLVLEYVGDEQVATEPESGGKRRRTEETVARQLRDTGRLQIDQLERYSDYLFGAIDFLEGEGIWHRDLKPDNIAIRVRPNRTRELVLIDFSLSWYPATQVEAGTDGYLDPFIGKHIIPRSSYDSHAERYALAITLHEMASGELPKWGDGSALPQQLDADEWPYPQIAADGFDPALRDGLVAFFRKALHRDTAQRFPDLKPMRDSWRQIFLALMQAVPSRSRHPEQVSERVTPAEERELAAEQVTRETHLSAAGLSPTAEQFLYGLEVTTVGELLDYGQRSLVTARGLGYLTRREIQQRQREWGQRLGKFAPAPLASEARKAAKAESTALAADLDALSLDNLITRFVPELKPDRSNEHKVHAVARLLRVPGDSDLPELGTWPTQAAVAKSPGQSSSGLTQLLRQERQRWKRNPAFPALRAQVLGLLAEFGRIASATELADALTASRGTRLDSRHDRRAMGSAVLRVVVEVEQLVPEEKAFSTQVRRAGAGTDGADVTVLLALEVDQDTEPDAPSFHGLVHYAQRLGRIADTLAAEETLPTAATALERFAAVDRPAEFFWDERRLAQIAVAASRTAAVTPRLEVYPRALPLVRAIRLTQAGLMTWIPGVRPDLQPGLEVKDVHERIRARFPDLAIDGEGGLPTGPALTKALRDAGFAVHLATRANTHRHRYLPDHTDTPSSYHATSLRRTTDTDRPTLSRYAQDPLVAAAARAEDSLVSAAERDGFRVLTVESRQVRTAADTLARRFAARPLSVTELFLTALRALVPPGTKPTWDTILRADIAAPGSKAAVKFSEYARTAWSSVEPRIAEQLPGEGPLLLTDAHVFARYGALGVLSRTVEQARRGRGAVWLLCPQPDADRDPHLGTVAVPYQSSLHEWIPLPASWVRNLHRATDTAAAPDAGQASA